MSGTFKKHKVGPKDLSPEQIVAYVMDRQPGGDYYSEAGQALMMWHITPRAAAVLGIAKPGERASQKEVGRRTLGQLLAGVNPATGKVFRKAGPDGSTVAAIDLTMSPAPKSVSVLWALGSNQLRYELETIVAKAADRAVMRMLQEQPFMRERFAPGPNGVRHVRAEDFVAVSALHTTARMSGGREVADPQLHLHYLLFGGIDHKDQLRAFDSYMLTKYEAELDAEASGHLAELLRERGFEIERELVERSSGQPRVAWEIKGVPASLVEAMSSRTGEIEDLKKRFMAEYGREPKGTAWDNWIVKQRGPKGKFTAAELRLAWGREAAEHGFDALAVEELVFAADQRRAVGVPVRGVNSEEAQEFKDQLLANVCKENALVPESDLDRLAHQLAVGLIPAALVDEVIAGMMGAGDLLVTLGEHQITTLEVLAWEQRAMRAVKRLLSEAPAPAVPAWMVEAELERRAAEGQPFDARQAEAVRIAVGGARFVSITGPAGTGKGVASAAITELFRSSTITLLGGAGRRVIALAVAGRTAQQAGADSRADLAMTLDDLHYRLGAGRLVLSRSDVLLVDEAGMIDHSRYADLLESAAQAGATVIQVGDDRQLAPVGPGGLWTSSRAQAAQAGTAVELRVVRRARDAREAAAWTAIREGRVEDGLTSIRDGGRLLLYDTREQLRAGMVDAWWEAGAERGLMVVDTSNAERDELNRLAQARRLEAGELGEEAVQLREGLELRAGDQVLFSAIYRPARAGAESERWVKRVENGTPAVVQEVDRIRREVELELRESGGIRVLRVGADAPIDLGYARHVFKAQGVTVDTAEMAVALRTRLNELYVMVSRAREGARVHVLAAEVEDAVSEARELEADLDGAAEADAQRLALAPAAGMSVAELEAELEAARARREELEAVTIREIGRRATPSTKVPVGPTPLAEPATSQPRKVAPAAVRHESRVGADLDRQDRTTDRWHRSPSLDAGAPAAASRAAAAAGAGKAPEKPAVSRREPAAAVRALPGRDQVESLGRRHMQDLDTSVALGFYQFAGRVDYSPEPMARAIALLAADREAVLVLGLGQVGRAQSELASHAELRADVEARGRLVDAETAYAERIRRREREQPAAWLVEHGAVPRGIVVADEAWASPELTRALSVAADSHLVSPPPSRIIAEEANAQERQMVEDRQRATAERSAQQAERARHAAHQRGLEAERQAAKGSEKAASVERGR